ncbi:TetR/AcrR family transcriptional regulator [Marivirga atlantica]|jgi:AcrR family transcriptional regulator|uniref:TetR/AcrR family transcriptional regulator n=1 Tax=Marivirga atlantica TaxID=1548457 RepID=A0A937ADG5_9BACT|nr:TetR/AcrR family transcriptional regulator [Marivirga atlantica]MBL0763629.1 TetR/AcrR family transcriptional regulator [Marivirga atlantica]
MNVHSATLNKIDKKTLILETTLECISEYGFHGTPISMIAEKAGVGAGTIYRYFDNKEVLINSLFLEIKRRVMHAMLEGYTETASFEARFKHLWMNLINYFMKHPQEFQFIEQHRYASYMSKLTREESFMIMSPVMLFFIEAKRAKAMKDMPVYTIISMTYGPITSLAKLQIDHKQKLSSERIEQAADACWDAVRMI